MPKCCAGCWSSQSKAAIERCQLAESVRRGALKMPHADALFRLVEQHPENSGSKQKDQAQSPDEDVKN